VIDHLGHSHRRGQSRMIDPLMPEKKRRNRLADRRLWDDTGTVWDLISSPLTAAAVEDLLHDESIRLCVHDDFAQPLRWIAASERQREIKSELQPWFSKDFKPRKRGRYFTMSLWGNGSRRLLLFDAD
jgi:hypothetical protein